MMAEPSGRPIALALSAVVLLAVGIGLYIIGSPAKARLHALDDRRAGDLLQTSYRISAYWESRAALPPVLDSLDPTGNDSLAYRDPATGAPYQYRVTGESTYELCAEFTYPSEDGYIVDPWRHPAGTHCFPMRVTTSSPAGSRPAPSGASVPSPP